MAPRVELRKGLNERARQFAEGAAAGCAAGAERTPDDALRFQSVIFALSKVLDKVRLLWLGLLWLGLPACTGRILGAYTMRSAVACAVQRSWTRCAPGLARPAFSGGVCPAHHCALCIACAVQDARPCGATCFVTTLQGAQDTGASLLCMWAAHGLCPCFPDDMGCSI